MQTLWPVVLRANGTPADAGGWGGPTSDLVVHVDCPTDVALEPADLPGTAGPSDSTSPNGAPSSSTGAGSSTSSSRASPRTG